MYNSLGDIALKFISLLPPLLVLIYMLTLKREYKIKKWIFPSAFAILALNTIFSICDSFYSYTYSSIDVVSFIIENFIILLIDMVILAGYVFAFLGSLNNFKRVVLLRTGMILCAIFVFVFFLLKGIYMAIIANIQNSFFAWISEITFYIGLFEQIMILLFYTSIFLLTLSKKSEYIDITPFVEERKAKKEMKKAEKQQMELDREALPSEAPEGYWCCMGCGKLLPNSENKCECGYKR